MPRDCYLSIYNRKDEKYENQKADNHAVHQLFMVERNKYYTTEITGISSDGTGVGAINGFTVFVPQTATGDLVRICIDKVFSRYAVGRLEKIIAPSVTRQEPSCPVFRECGGCSLRHIKYPAQLDAKRVIIESAFHRIGRLSDIRCDGMLGTDIPERYRNKCIFQIGTDTAGELIYGFYADKSHTIIPVADCLNGANENAVLCRALTDHMKENNIPAYDDKTGKGIVKRLFIRKSASTGEIMAAVSINADSLPKTERLIGRFKDSVGGVKSIYININKDKRNSGLGAKNILIYGSPEISDTLCGVTFGISPQSFYQINPYMTEKLYNRALEYADISKSDTVLDVYCGIGTISLAAAKRAERVTGIEIVKQAAADAEKNARRNGISNAEFFADSAENAVPKLIESGMEPDVVILDPPRKGSDEATLSAIVTAAPKRIVYVSCNPATLARDAKYLAANGYSPVRYTGVDMFPHTSHVETVVLLSKVQK